MRIIHRISLQSSRQVRATLARFGIIVPESGLITFEVDESGDDWPGIKSWIEREDPLDMVTTSFSSDEIAAARWLKLVPDWHRGYPQPEGNRGYLEATYDLTDYCPACGIGRKQRAPFQMRSEPKWGRNAILQLNWVFDEYFVKPEVHASIFEPRGISSRPVTNTKGNQLNTVVQLVIDEEVGIVSYGLAEETCPRCGRPKYLPVTRGPFPALRTEPKGAAAKTKEYFGSGASAHKGVLVSQELGRELMSKKIRGASLDPVASR